MVDCFLKSPRQVFSSLCEISKNNPQIDNSYKIIFGIDNMVTVGIFDLPFLIEFLFAEWLMLDVLPPLWQEGTILGNYSGKNGRFFHIRKVNSIKWEYVP